MNGRSETVIVTGAAGNLGSAVAADLAARGTRLVLVDRAEDGLAELARRLPPDTEYLSRAGIDLNDKAAADAVVAAAVHRFGAVTGLVNTVGGFRVGRVAEE